MNIQKKSIILVFTIISLTSGGCSLSITNKTRYIKHNGMSFKEFKPSHRDTLRISTISVLTRISYESPYRKFSRARVAGKTNHFKEIVEGIKQLKSDYLISFKDENNITNDSLFKPLLNDNNFRNGFFYNQMQTLDFSNNEDGLHVIVTVIKETGCVPGWQNACVYDITFLYDFFKIESGKLVQYSSIKRSRDASANNKKPENRWKPIPRDTRRVFKKLYKLKE